MFACKRDSLAIKEITYFIETVLKTVSLQKKTCSCNELMFYRYCFMGQAELICYYLNDDWMNMLMC